MSQFTFRHLDVWKQGMGLVEQIYRSTQPFPRSEQYGITNQIRRATLSIPCNIAEGHCRRSTKAFMNHVSIALGSHGELETLLEVSCRLGFLGPDEHRRLSTLAATVGRLLNGLYNSLERTASGGERVDRQAKSHGSDQVSVGGPSGQRGSTSP